MSRSAAFNSGFQMSKIRMARGVSDRFQASCSMVSSNTHACPGIHSRVVAPTRNPHCGGTINGRCTVQARVGDAGMRGDAGIGIEDRKQRRRCAARHSTAGYRPPAFFLRSPDSAQYDPPPASLWFQRKYALQRRERFSSRNWSMGSPSREVDVGLQALAIRRPVSAATRCESPGSPPRAHRARGNTERSKNSMGGEFREIHPRRLRVIRATLAHQDVEAPDPGDVGARRRGVREFGPRFFRARAPTPVDRHPRSIFAWAQAHP